MSIHLKKQIVEMLEEVASFPDSHTKYRNILQFVKEMNIALTKNKRGYWFDISSLPERETQDLYDIIVGHIKNSKEEI
jgi:hypothetical protein